MVNFATALYETPSLDGDFLLQPSKVANTFFNKTKEGEKVSLLSKVENILCQILVSPVTAIGLVVKLCGVPSLRKHNEKMIREINEKNLDDWVREIGLVGTSGILGIKGQEQGCEEIQAGTFTVEKKVDFHKEIISNVASKITKASKRLHKITYVEAVSENDNVVVTLFREQTK